MEMNVFLTIRSSKPNSKKNSTQIYSETEKFIKELLKLKQTKFHFTSRWVLKLKLLNSEILKKFLKRFHFI